MTSYLAPLQWYIARLFAEAVLTSLIDPDRLWSRFVVLALQSEAKIRPT